MNEKTLRSFNLPILQLNNLLKKSTKYYIKFTDWFFEAKEMDDETIEACIAVGLLMPNGEISLQTIKAIENTIGRPFQA